MSGPAERLIVALDCQTLGCALAQARRLRGVVRWVKVGSPLFTGCGPEVVRRLRALGFFIMLDLKWHDIPSSVALSCRAAARLGVSLVTVHAMGGRAMLEAAVEAARAEAAREGLARPRVLAVTVLTSVAAARASALRRTVLRLARLARRAGCDGVVASAQDAPALRRALGERLYLVCPGIRPAPARRPGRTAASSWRADDQRRVATPADALAAGADALVIGRPITAAARPRAAARQILAELTARAPA
jgi:orotidine-5'-phosphate decarboxylase